MAKRYAYKTKYVDQNGDLVEEERQETLEELKDRYWQNWADQRIIMQMGTSEEDFLNDMKVIFKMEEVK